MDGWIDSRIFLLSSLPGRRVCLLLLLLQKLESFLFFCKKFAPLAPQLASGKVGEIDLSNRSLPDFSSKGGGRDGQSGRCQLRPGKRASLLLEVEGFSKRFPQNTSHRRLAS